MKPDAGLRHGPVAMRTISTLALLLLFSFPTFAAAKCAADYYVDSLPGQPDGPLLKMHAGHIEVDEEHNGNLFFWHFHNRHIDNRQRTVIWLNGGPGCSSMDGALMELGPYRLKDDHTLEYLDGSWDEFANLLFVDQPVGTGFSYANTDSYLHDLDQMADHFITFLDKWFEMFPEYRHDDLYLAGESYAGQYIPYIAKAILDRNGNQTKADDKKADHGDDWNLKGLLIGNGWVSPAEHYESYLTFAFKEDLIKPLSSSAKRIEAMEEDCAARLREPGGKDLLTINECEAILQAILEETRDGDKCINMYDIRLKDTSPSCGMNWPPDLDNVSKYLRRSDVVKALHINDDKKTGWTECSGAVSGKFNARNSKPSINLLPGLLEAGIPVVLFSGSMDLICNHIGTEEMIHNMKWSGGTGFELSPGVWAPRHDWTFEGESAGIYQEARNLTYVEFYNASHMVPFDYPRRSRDMLDRFIGVDITGIGGDPADSRIDGLKGNPTSVGGHPNSTAAEEEEAEKVKMATWEAYYKAGEVALVVVIIIASVWGYFIWRARRQRQGSGYQGIYPNHEGLSSGSLPRFQNRRAESDIEAAAEFNEAELDNLESNGLSSSGAKQNSDHYAIGGESDEEEEDSKGEKKQSEKD